MSIAERRVVPLNSRCSRKCVEPWWPSASSLEPTPTQHPNVAERSPGMVSVSTLTPPGRTERRTMAPPASPLTVCSAEPAGLSGSGMPVTSGVRPGRFLRRGGTLATRGVGLVLGQYRHQRQLAPGVDGRDLHLDLLPDGEHVLD